MKLLTLFIIIYITNNNKQGASPAQKPNKMNATEKNNQFLYLKDINQEDPFIYVTYKDRIKDVQLNECFDRYGQSFTNEAAGDWSIYNQYADADHSCVQDILKEFKITALKYGYDNPEDIDFLGINYKGEIEIQARIETDELENFDEEKINLFIKKWEKENADYTTVEGFNYWDGRNNRSIIISSDYDSVRTHEKLYAHEIPEVNFDDLEFIKDGFGEKLYKYGEYYVISSNYASAWELYKIIEIDSLPSNFAEEF